MNLKLVLAGLVDMRDGLNHIIEEVTKEAKGSGGKKAKPEPEEDEEEKPAKKPAKKSPPKKDDEDEEDDEDADEEDEPKASKKKPVKKPSKKDEDDEDEEEEDDEDSDDDEEEVDEDDIENLPRVKLIPIAKKLGIDTTGKQVSDLRKAIGAARKKGNSKSNPKKAPAKKSSKSSDDDDDDGDGDDARPEALPKKHLRVLQDTLAELIEGHQDELEEAIKEMGCGGDCYNCPKPEEKTVQAQVIACLVSTAEHLEIDLPKEVQKLVA